MSMLDQIARSHSSRVVAKKADEEKPVKPVKSAKPAPASSHKAKPRENARLVKLLTLAPQELFIAIVKMSHGFNVTETTVSRLLHADVETVHDNLSHASAKQVVAAFESVLDLTHKGWRKEGSILNTEKSVFFVKQDPKQTTQELAQHLLMVEEMEKRRKDKKDDEEEA
jgi:hypothetical protein